MTFIKNVKAISKTLMISIIVIIIVVAGIIGFAMFQKPAQTTTTTTTTTITTTTTTVTMPIKSITIATGTVGGVYIYYGGGLATIYSKYLGIQASAVQTKASVDNLLYISKDPTGTMGLVLSDTIYDAWNGKLSAFNNTPQQWIRVLWIMYNNYIHIVTRSDSGIKTVYDLKGKRVSTGPPASGTELTALSILNAAGIDPSKDFPVWQKLGPAESAGALLDNKIDAFFWSGGLPTGSISELSVNLKQRGLKIAFIAVPTEVFNKLDSQRPGIYMLSILKKDVYDAVEDVQTLVVPNLIVVHKDMPDDAAYLLTKTVFEHLDELYAVHVAAKDTKLDTAPLYKGAPYHPGAIRFYKEAGVWPGG